MWCNVIVEAKYFNNAFYEAIYECNIVGIVGVVHAFVGPYEWFILRLRLGIPRVVFLHLSGSFRAPLFRRRPNLS